jgi:hypothetical protein
VGRAGVHSAVSIPLGIEVRRLAPTSDDNLIYLQGSSTLDAVRVAQSARP